MGCDQVIREFGEGCAKLGYEVGADEGSQSGFGGCLGEDVDVELGVVRKLSISRGLVPHTRLVRCRGPLPEW